MDIKDVRMMAEQCEEEATAYFEEEHPPWRAVRASNPKPRKPVLIDGLLRLGLVMLISAKGKIGKTYLCIQLAICVAFGLEWLGLKCGQGRVLIVNPEVDEDSFDNRMHEMCELMNVNEDEADTLIDVWNTRKNPVTIGEIINKVERFAPRGYYSLIILDSVSCYLEGDENKSKDIREFTGQVNKLAESARASVAMVQHYGKGNQGDRDASDRARGSSVFLDAPDAVLTITEVFPPTGEVEDYLEKDQSAFRIECAGMREFGRFEPFNVIRKHPLVCLDEDGITSEWAFDKSGNGGNGGKAKKLVDEANRERDFMKYQTSIVAEFMNREEDGAFIACKEAAELIGIEASSSDKASKKLKDMFFKYGEPCDYVEGEFTTKAYSTDLLMLRQRPKKRKDNANPSAAGQGYFIYPRFKVSQISLDLGE